MQNLTARLRRSAHISFPIECYTFTSTLTLNVLLYIAANVCLDGFQETGRNFSAKR